MSNIMHPLLSLFFFFLHQLQKFNLRLWSQKVEFHSLIIPSSLVQQYFMSILLTTQIPSDLVSR